MPRSALLFLTAVVLALHGLVLGGLSLGGASDPGPATSTRVFSTRSLAAQPAIVPPPATPAPRAAERPKAPAVATPRPRPAPAQPAATPDTVPPPSAENMASDGAATASVPSANTLPAAIGQSNATDAMDAMDATDATDATGATDAIAPLDQAPSNAAAEAATGRGGAGDTAEPITLAAPPVAPAASAADESNLIATSQPDITTTGTFEQEITPPGGSAGTPSTTPPAPVRLPPPTRLAFNVSGQAKKLSYHARAELVWQHTGDRYEARQEVSAFLIGSRRQSSTGQVTPQGLQPERFADRARSEQAAHFDYAQGRIIFSANTPPANARPGVQDRLSVFIQLGALLAAEPERFVLGTLISLTTVSARSADRWTFTVEGPETLDLPAGSTPTLKLQRLPRKEYDQKAELWLAPALGYLPARIKLTQANGDFADLLLRSSGPP